MGIHNHIHTPPWKLREAHRCFRRGGIIAYPTEAVFGLGCDPLDALAVHRLLELKQRSVEKGLILIAADFAQLRPFVSELNAGKMERVFESWPGPVTWLLPAPPTLPYWLSGEHETLAVRVTAHPVAAALCRICNSPLVSTSANIAGHPPAKNAMDIRRYFNGNIDCILNGPVGSGMKPTPIRDARTGEVTRA